MEIKLQGISEPQPAIRACDLKPGMIRLYNFGEVGEIISVTPSKTGKSVMVTVRENGKEYTRRMMAETLVAVRYENEEVGQVKQKKELGTKRNAYNLKSELLRRKYQNVIADFEAASDDRRLAFNIYHKLLEVCGEMEEMEVENPTICCAVNSRIDLDEQTIDRIVTRFTGKSFINHCWMTSEEAETAGARKVVSSRLVRKRLAELNARFNEYGISIENASDTGGNFVKLVVNLAATGASSTTDTREFIWWVRKACEDADRFEYNGYRISYEEPENYIQYTQDGEDEVIEFLNGESADAVFGKAAEIVAFDDLSNIEVGKIVVNGRECRYAGWQPGMHIAFEDCETGETVWEDYFPEWDH